MAGDEQLEVLNLKKFLNFFFECCCSGFSEVLVLQVQLGQQWKDIPALGSRSLGVNYRELG